MQSFILVFPPHPLFQENFDLRTEDIYWIEGAPTLLLCLLSTSHCEGEKYCAKVPQRMQPSDVFALDTRGKEIDVNYSS